MVPHFDRGRGSGLGGEMSWTARIISATLFIAIMIPVGWGARWIAESTSGWTQTILVVSILGMTFFIAWRVDRRASRREG